MDNIIQKVISGNASQEERSQLDAWIAISEDNKKYFDKQNLLWDVVGKGAYTPEVDVNKAFARFTATIENQSATFAQRSFMIYKIAALFILVIGFGGIYFLFNASNEIIHTQSAKANQEKNQLEQTNTQLANESNTIKVSSEKLNRFQKRNDSVSYNEIELVDSSSAKIITTSVLKVLDHSPSQPRIASLSGAGLFDIKPSDKDFILETSDLKIKVQGTKFKINTETPENLFVEISVEEGFMEVFEKANPSNKVTISSKEKYIYDIVNHTFVEKTEVKIEPSKWSKFVSKMFHKSH